MAKKRGKATLRGAWWKAQLARIRHCFVCGGALDKRYVKNEGRRRQVCSVCGEITYLNPKVVAGLIPVMPDGRVALLRRDIEPARGKWTHPAGYQEMGESVAEAAERETMEEIVTRVKAGELLGVYSYPDAGVVTVVFVGAVPRSQKPKAGHESQAVALFKPDEIPWDDLAFRSTTDALEDWLAKSLPAPRRHKRPPPRERERLSARGGVAKPRP